MSLELLLTPGIILGQEQSRKNLSHLLTSCDYQGSRLHTLCEIYLPQFSLLAYWPVSCIELLLVSREHTLQAILLLPWTPSFSVLDKDGVAGFNVSLVTKPSSSFFQKCLWQPCLVDSILIIRWSGCKSNQMLPLTFSQTLPVTSSVCVL